MKLSTPGLNGSLSSHFWWLLKSNCVKFTECDVYGEARFSKKNDYKLAKFFKESRNSIYDEDRCKILTLDRAVNQEMHLCK